MSRIGAALVVALAAAGCDQASGSVALVGGPALAASSSGSAAPAPAPAGWLPSLDGAASPSATASSAPSAIAAGWPTPSASAAPSAAAPSASVVADAPPPPCPADMALVGTTCVDHHEAHLLLLGDDGARTLHPYNQRPAEGARYAAANEAGRKPQGYISRVESQAACVAAGKRLCSRREWRAACRGKGGSRWPYGHQGVRSRCNSGKPHLLTVHFGDVRNIKYDEHFNSPRLNADPIGLAASGAHAECTNPHGTFDMVGNLHEWVSGSVDADLVYAMEDEKVERRDQPWQTGNGIFMGGFYSTTSEHGAGCDFTTIAHEPSYHDYSTGFRCCRDAVRPASPQKLR